MKEAVLAVFAVVVVSVLALGIMVYPSSTGEATMSQYGVYVSANQYSPAQYGYFYPDYQYPTSNPRCVSKVPCRVLDKSCPSGASVFVDGSSMGCSVSLVTPNCAHNKIGWNGGRMCDVHDSSMTSQCVCP